MTMNIRIRVVALAGCGALLLLIVGAPATAQSVHAQARSEPGNGTLAQAGTEQPQQGQQDKKARKPKPSKPAKPARPARRTEQVRPDDRSDEHDRTDEHDRNDRQAQAAASARLQRQPRPQQDGLVRQQQQRLAQYREQIALQQAVLQEQAARLQRQNRLAQQRSQQQYAVRLRQQQLQVQQQGRYDYAGDPYVSMPSSYRYARGGRYYQTNQYGIDLLRQAINYGYEEGWRAGEADRADRWRGGYEDSYAYQDATYGYRGLYVDRDDYNNYFREGFRRGYDDGYRAQSQYGHFANGRGAIRGTVLSIILNVEVIR